LVLFVAGIALLIYKRKSFRLTPAPEVILPGKRFKTVFLNPGMLLFILLSLALLIYAAV
jgi:hypothetical protein